MATTMMKSSDPAIAAMQELMRKRVEAEPMLALKMANPSKSMEGAINFLCNEVKKSGLTMLSDKDVESILVHYWDEDNIEEVKNVNCNIVVSKPELSEVDKAELREQAMKEYKEEQLRAIRRENQPKPQAKATTSAPKQGSEINVEPNLFGEDF